MSKKTTNSTRILKTRARFYRHARKGNVKIVTSSWTHGLPGDQLRPVHVRTVLLRHPTSRIQQKATLVQGELTARHEPALQTNFACVELRFHVNTNQDHSTIQAHPPEAPGESHQSRNSHSRDNRWHKAFFCFSPILKHFWTALATSGVPPPASKKDKRPTSPCPQQQLMPHNPAQHSKAHSNLGKARCSPFYHASQESQIDS